MKMIEQQCQQIIYGKDYSVYTPAGACQCVWPIVFIMIPEQGFIRLTSELHNFTISH